MKISENISANTSDRREAQVIEYDNAAYPKKFIDEEEIYEHVIEVVLAIDKGKMIVTRSSVKWDKH